MPLYTKSALYGFDGGGSHDYFRRFRFGIQSATTRMSKLVIAVLLLLCVAQVNAQTNSHTARLGDLQVTLTAARIASSQDVADYGLHPRDGYNIALVFVRVKDVARYPSCAFPDEWLVVKQGYVYPSMGKLSVKAPQTNGLLPTDESSGTFAFEMKAGTEPASLKLVRGIADNACAEMQHREAPIAGPESVMLSLAGLPASIASDIAREQPVQPSSRQAMPPATGPITPPSLPAPAGGSRGASGPAQPDTENNPTTQIDGTPVFHPGKGGVGYPSCLYCPEPQYSEEARKAKFNGSVILQVTIQPDGHATDIQVVKGAGFGLDEKAIEAVRTWRFKPAIGPNGVPVATITTLPVLFRLL